MRKKSNKRKKDERSRIRKSHLRAVDLDVVHKTPPGRLIWVCLPSKPALFGACNPE